MAATPKPPLHVEDLQGFRYLRRFGELWEPLRACAIDKSGNRRFFFDQYLSLLLLYFFSPVVTSLRGLQQAAGLDKVARELGLRGAPALGTLSAAARDFDPELLKPVIRELAGRAVPVVDGREAEALAGLTAVDGSLWRCLPRMAWALWMDEDHRGCKMHLHFDVFKGVPLTATLTPGACSEVAELGKTVEPGRFYVMDRGYACHALMADILKAGSSFLVRLKLNAAFVVTEERPVSEAARKAGVIRDVIVSRLGTSHHKDEIGRPLRLVWVATGRTGEETGEPEVLLLCTDRLALEAELVGTGYRYRWWVELFFRWLKCILGCRHLLSDSQRGVTIQIYVALIASLLVSLTTGAKPTRRTYEMMCFFFAGMAGAHELQRHLDDLAKRRDGQKARDGPPG